MSVSPARKQQKKLERDKEKKRLMQLSKERAQKVNPPTYGIKEGDLLSLRETVKQLVQANNNRHQIFEDYEKTIKPKVLEAHYMCQVILKILVDKGLSTTEEIEALTREVQSRDNGYSSKGPNARAEKGDMLLVSFVLYDEKGEVVDDRSKEMLAYNLGGGGLPCDEQLIGIVKGESRHLTVVFGEGFTHKHLIGHPLMMHIVCHDVQVKAAN